jgi:uncharacterized delta-60 repeat protein
MRARVRRTATAIILGLALLVPGASQAAGRARPGAVLDSSFGDHGVVRLSSESAFTAYGTATRGGDLLVSGGSGIKVLNRHGGTGRAFGGIGSLNLSPAQGDRFELGGFTIDPHGRLLVVGTSLFPETENPSPPENGSRAFRPGAVRILRLLPDGRLDPNFGHKGVVETDLGLSAPLGTEGEPLGTHPAVRATGIAVGPQGRIVVTGSAVVRLGESCEHDSFAPAPVSAGFVARFTESGAPDTSFGTDGLVGGHALSENRLGAEVIGEPVVGQRGEITYRSTLAYPCERDRSHIGIAQLSPDGRARTAFGKKGAMVGPYSCLAGAPDGSVVALAEPSRLDKEPFRAQVTQIAANGAPDGSFGKDGHVTVKFGPYSSTILDSVAVDRRGRILVGGTLETDKGPATVLLGVSARGTWERSFGPKGRVVTPVVGVANLEAGHLFFDSQSRLVTVDRYAKKGHYGLAVAGYLLRN